MALSRRDFLTRVGNAGGYSAAFLAMQGLGLMKAKAAEVTIDAAPDSGKGTKVVVLGAGIAGLVAAYEMRALGYDVTVLEARSRPGGRNWTVRGGDTVTFIDGVKQQCRWEPGNYQNFGPARLPSVHQHILGYCRKLGVELQVEINMTSSAFLQNDAANGGQPLVMRQAVNDTRGRVSELLMKSMNAGALDADLDAQDREKMLAFLRIYGPLDQAGRYVGSDRAGYKQLAGAGNETGVLSDPIDMHTLLQGDFWQGMLFDQQFDMQATMFQPVGGMDRIPYAFTKSLGPLVKFNVPVTEIRKTSKGVKVLYKENGSAKAIEADYCMCGLPLTMLKAIPNDFSAPYKKVIDECTYASAYKIAWESRRFWEQDYNIYGGLEFCNTGCSPIWFPSANLFADRGIVVGGYSDEAESPFGKLSLPEKFEESRKSVERLHPGHGKELEKPMYVGWGHVSYNEGSWIRSYTPEDEEVKFGVNPATTQTGDGGTQAPGMVQNKNTGGAAHPAAARTQTNIGYQTLTVPDDRVIFIGDHVSHIVAWQEGAAVSALYGVNQLTERVKAARLVAIGKSASA